MSNSTEVALGLPLPLVAYNGPVSDLTVPATVYATITMAISVWQGALYLRDHGHVVRKPVSNFVMVLCVLEILHAFMAVLASQYYSAHTEIRLRDLASAHWSLKPMFATTYIAMLAVQYSLSLVVLQTCEVWKVSLGTVFMCFTFLAAPFWPFVLLNPATNYINTLVPGSLFGFVCAASIGISPPAATIWNRSPPKIRHAICGVRIFFAALSLVSVVDSVVLVYMGKDGLVTYCHFMFNLTLLELCGNLYPALLIWILRVMSEVPCDNHKVLQPEDLSYPRLCWSLDTDTRLLQLGPLLREGKFKEYLEQAAKIMTDGDAVL